MTSTTIIGMLLACAAVAVATFSGWLLTFIAVRLYGGSWPAAAVPRARVLAFVRLLPLSSVAVLVPAQVIAFARHEGGGAESVGALLACVAGVGTLLLSDVVRRVLITAHRTGGIVRRWKGDAEAIAVRHWSGAAWSIAGAQPVVAVAGVIRPQLFIHRQVIEQCSGAELAAIAAHESAHVAAADNLVRWLFRLTPGASWFACIAQPLEASWAAAAEQAADGSASSLTSAVELASALTKVARLGVSLAPDRAVASTLISDNNLRDRVHRLLASPSVRPERTNWSPLLMAFVATFTVLVTSPASATLHRLFELLVHHP